MGSWATTCGNDVDPVQAVVAVGRLLIGQVAILDSGELGIGAFVGSLDPGAGLRCVFRVARFGVGRHE